MRSRGRSAGTPTSGTTSRRRWRCSSPAGSTPPTARGSGCAGPSAHDGSWPMKTVGGVVEDASGETNMAAYVAVGVWHHWLVRRDGRSSTRMWPVVRRALDFVVRAAAAVRRHRLVAGVDGGRPGARQPRGPARRLVEHPPRAARRGHAGRAPRRPAARVGAGRRPPRPRAARAPRPVPGQVDVLDGLVLPGARRRRPRRRRAARCSQPLGRLRGARARGALRRHRPVGHRRRDLRAGAGARRARRPRARAARCSPTRSTCGNDDGGYWTGYVYPDDVHWPAEHTTFTTAAVLLAHDALAEATPGADVVRGAGWCPTPSRSALECGCASADALAGHA